MWVVAEEGYKTAALLLPGRVGVWGGGGPSGSLSHEEEDRRQVSARKRNVEVAISEVVL